MIGGIVTTAAAPVLLIAGYFWVEQGYDSCVSGISHTGATASDLAKVHDCQDTRTNRFYGVLGASAVLALAGVPMIIIGAHKVRDRSVPEAMLTPYVSPDRAGLALQLKFD
ncbi:MAG TPA: hypothetical protein VHB79_27495 [Polyangiaceae bacterium]|nr:hypothetical protein [Polyangiaceae bacterium]